MMFNRFRATAGIGIFLFIRIARIAVELSCRVVIFYCSTWMRHVENLLINAAVKRVPDRVRCAV